ncbi:MAG: ThuA domain-containing protein [Chloroflexota bacterium]|nr:ThuA domain-containing protein [Chloroflexota bacterium]MDE2908892.1 ThuA domain-containing protein [Chloroflexota bacterium]
MTAPIRVTVWNEFWHENPIHWDYVQKSWMSHGYSQESAIEETVGVREIYPDGIHEAIATPLRARGFSVRAATLDEPEHGLSEAVLDQTDVMIWWGHIAHDKFDDAVAENVYQRVVDGGMGFIALHWGAGSKVFKKLMGTTCTLTPLVGGAPEKLWVIEPAHPIARGLETSFVVPQTEIYCEPFDIPAPDTIVFISSWNGGEVCRSGCCFQRGRGRVFFFRPGHESYPIYYQSEIQQVIANAVRWAAGL